MSSRHPIIALTGSSGSGTTIAGSAFAKIFHQEKISPAYIDGDGFHKYSRKEMDALVNTALQAGKDFSHFGASANDFARLETLFSEYGTRGTGVTRRYLHNKDEAKSFNQAPGTFTAWETLGPSDLLFYEGLHGGVITDTHNVAQHVDLLIGMTPTINLEWIQKISRDTKIRGYSHETVTANILRRMPDYVKYIVPQFSRTHINFQRVPMVDTSNPFIDRIIPSPSETLVVIHFRQIQNVNFKHYLETIPGSFMSAPSTIVVPGSQMLFAIELMLTPIIKSLIEQKTRQPSCQSC